MTVKTSKKTSVISNAKNIGKNDCNFKCKKMMISGLTPYLLGKLTLYK